MHVLLSGHDESVEDDVLGRFTKQGAARVHVDGRALDKRLIAFLRVFTCRVPEEA